VGDVFDIPLQRRKLEALIRWWRRDSCWMIEWWDWQKWVWWRRNEAIE
jgi:hypothetical protein